MIIQFAGFVYLEKRQSLAEGQGTESHRPWRLEQGVSVSPPFAYRSALAGRRRRRGGLPY